MILYDWFFVIVRNINEPKCWSCMLKNESFLYPESFDGMRGTFKNFIVAAEMDVTAYALALVTRCWYFWHVSTEVSLCSSSTND